jgi:hypothetical protein
MKSISTRIRDTVESTLFVDTHEHLPDESTRLAFKAVDSKGAWDRVVQDKVDDWSFLFVLYGYDDLCSAGLRFDVLKRFWHDPLPPQEKFDLIAQQWQHMRHTGYGQAIRHTLRILYGEADLTRDSAPRIAEQYEATRGPGFYQHILRNVSRVHHCHVNTFTHAIFHETERPDLLRQDIDMTSVTDPTTASKLALEMGIELTSLEAWLHLIDRIFAIHAPRASAVKLQTAYDRDLNFLPTDQRRAEYAFQRYRSGFAYGSDEKADLHNFLLRYTIQRATEAGLAIKLHTGIGCLATLYGDPTPVLPIAHARNHQSDLCRLYQDFPDARFVLFHIGYPYHHEVVAMAKLYRNVFVDMCWAWILDPAESIRFLRSYLTTAPFNKLFTFGGDNLAVEMVVGHAHIARAGIVQALVSLVKDRLLNIEETPGLIEAIMHGNAIKAFGDSGGSGMQDGQEAGLSLRSMANRAAVAGDA